MPVNQEALLAIKLRIVALRLVQGAVAVEAGYEETLFNKYLNGRRSTPEHFIARAAAAIDRLADGVVQSDDGRVPSVAGK